MIMLELFKKKYPRFGAEIKPSTTRLVTENIEENGVMKQTSRFKEVSLSDNYKQFTSTDFAITNLMAVGATNLLRPVSMVNNDVAGVAQQFDNLANTLDKQQNGNAE